MQQRTKSGKLLFSIVLPSPEDELSIENIEGLPIDIEPILADYGIDFDSM